MAAPGGVGGGVPLPPGPPAPGLGGVPAPAPAPAPVPAPAPAPVDPFTQPPKDLDARGHTSLADGIQQTLAQANAALPGTDWKFDPDPALKVKANFCTSKPDPRNPTNKITEFAKAGEENSIVMKAFKPDRAAADDNTLYFCYDIQWEIPVKSDTPPPGQTNVLKLQKTIYTNIPVPKSGNIQEMENAKNRVLVAAKTYRHAVKETLTQGKNDYNATLDRLRGCSSIRVNLGNYTFMTHLDPSRPSYLKSNKTYGKVTYFLGGSKTENTYDLTKAPKSQVDAAVRADVAGNREIHTKGMKARKQHVQLIVQRDLDPSGDYKRLQDLEDLNGGKALARLAQDAVGEVADITTVQTEMARTGVTPEEYLQALVAKSGEEKSEFTANLNYLFPPESKLEKLAQKVGKKPKTIPAPTGEFTRRKEAFDEAVAVHGAAQAEAGAHPGDADKIQAQQEAYVRKDNAEKVLDQFVSARMQYADRRMRMEDLKKNADNRLKIAKALVDTITDPQVKAQFQEGVKQLEKAQTEIEHEMNRVAAELNNLDGLVEQHLRAQQKQRGIDQFRQRLAAPFRRGGNAVEMGAMNPDARIEIEAADEDEIDLGVEAEPADDDEDEI